MHGAVGTVVEALDTNSALVEFSDEEGRAYAVVPCAYSDLMILHYAPEATWRATLNRKPLRASPLQGAQRSERDQLRMFTFTS